MSKKKLAIIIAILIAIGLVLMLINKIRKPSGPTLEQKFQSLKQNQPADAVKMDPEQAKKAIEELNKAASNSQKQVPLQKVPQE